MSEVEDEVCEKIQARSEVGKAKYGVTMERDDLTHDEWLEHLQHEMMDAVIYIQRLRTREQTIEAKLHELVAELRIIPALAPPVGYINHDIIFANRLEALLDEVSA